MSATILTMAYFIRTGPSTFRATEQVAGAWSPDEQHIAPAIGLIAHAIERDRDQRRDDAEQLPITRLSYDILGTLPPEEVEISVRVQRPGRTIELVEATLTHAGRPAVIAHAWLLQERDTASFAATSLEPLRDPAGMPGWDPLTIWEGNFLRSVDIQRETSGPGRSRSWVSTEHELVEGEPVSPLAAVAGLFDIANGLAPRADPSAVAFPNVDLTAHLFRNPIGMPLGFDTEVSFGSRGVGLTSSVLHDSAGPFGTLNQILTIRPGR